MSHPSDTRPHPGIAALARQHRLPAGAAAQLSTLARCLDEEHVPSTVRGFDAICDDHLADSLVALELGEVRSAGSIADLGSGAGVPGLVLAIARPGAEVHLVESQRRKADFIARSAGACGLSNVSVVIARAEAWPEGLERFDLVTARALGALPVVAEYAAPLLRRGGALVAWRGQINPDEEAGSRAAADTLGLRYEPPRPVRPHPAARHRHLQCLVKIATTPDRFPRRPGMARKRPLGSLGNTGV